jgi:hypothetical protein
MADRLTRASAGRWTTAARRMRVMTSDDLPVSRADLLRPAADALAEDWTSYDGPLERLGPGSVDFRHQLALIRDDAELLIHVLRGIGVYTLDDSDGPRGRSVWMSLDPHQEDHERARHEVAVAQSALEERLQGHRDRIRPHGDGGMGLELAIQLDRIRANPALREKVLHAFEFYRRAIKVRGQDRTVWFRWQPGDPPTAFAP